MKFLVSHVWAISFIVSSWDLNLEIVELLMAVEIDLGKMPTIVAGPILWKWSLTRMLWGFWRQLYWGTHLTHVWIWYRMTMSALKVKKNICTHCKCLVQCRTTILRSRTLCIWGIRYLLQLVNPFTSLQSCQQQISSSMSLMRWYTELIWKWWIC